MLLKNTFRAFRHRDYLIFWSGLFLGHTGTLVQATAQAWLIFQLTDSPFYLGLAGLCLGLPRVLFSAPPYESEQSISRYAGRYNSGMDEGALSTVVYAFRNSNFWH